MPEEKILFCIRYNPMISLENRKLKVFVEVLEKCSGCNQTVMMSQESKKMLDSDASMKVLCEVCIAKNLKEDDQPEFRVSDETFNQIQNYLLKKQAQKN